jgi:hypothetical protein
LVPFDGRNAKMEDDKALLFEAFSLVAEDAKEADVHYAEDAQREVVPER